MGPKAERPVRLDYAWKSIETNEVGLDEFSNWADQVGTEVMMAVNLGTRGVEEAAQLAEYCLVEGGTAMSELRKSHGREKPYPFKVWCLGNEMDGPWQICNKSAAEYGVQAREAGKLLKRLDPSLELVACGSSSRDLPTYPDWDATVLEYSYEFVDYLSVHMYLSNKANNLADYLCKSLQMDDYIQSIVATCDYIKAKKRSAKTMYLSFDEWNAVPSTWKENNAKPWIKAPALCEGSFTMADTVVFGSMLISLIKHSDRIRIACIAQLVNIFGAIMTAPDSGIAWKQSIYYPFLHASLYGRGNALAVKADVPLFDTDSFKNVPQLESVAVYNEETGELTVFAVNRSVTDSLQLEFELRGFAAAGAAPFEQVEYTVIQNSDPNAINSAEQPFAIMPELSDAAQIKSGVLTASLPALSWNVLRLKP